MKLAVGTKVKLKESVRHKRPNGRADNKESKIAVITSGIGGVRVYPDLGGRNFWNEEDLEEIE
jgi:hypothetical protein